MSKDTKPQAVKAVLIWPEGQEPGTAAQRAIAARGVPKLAKVLKRMKAQGITMEIMDDKTAKDGRGAKT